MRTNSQSWEVENLPDSDGKSVLIKILNTPVPDFSELKKEVSEYHRIRKEERELVLMKQKIRPFDLEEKALIRDVESGKNSPVSKKEYATVVKAIHTLCYRRCGFKNSNMSVE